MAYEWKQTCKDCGKVFGYSDISLQRDLKKGLSRAERCDNCRKQHSVEISSIASSHFALKPRDTKPSILGYSFLGKIDHGGRLQPDNYEKEADPSGVNIGLDEENIEQVYEALKEHQVIVVVAPTGSGKSTYIPSKLLFPLAPLETDYFTKRGPIIITQPRIPATIQIPNAIGEKFCGCSVGKGFDIGYRYSGEENYDLKRNRMIFVTDGSLINWITAGMIDEFSMIVIDEAHERSYNIESIINMVYRELIKYPHLKFMIISATIDAYSFINHFSKTTSVKLLDFSNCTKTVGYEEYPWKYSELKEDDFSENIYEKNKIAGEKNLNIYKSTVAYKLADQIIEILKSHDSGGVLGFLDGKENINKAVERIRDVFRNRTDIKVFPFHAELSKEEIDAALNEKLNGHRVIIATNSAETSLTVKDIVYVVDSGIIKEEEWNSTTCRKELNTKFHSKAGCKQRWGRAGRVQKGYVHKLYSKEQFIKYFPNYTIPAIQRSNAETLILDAIASGASNIEHYEMLTKPKDEEWGRALDVVKKRGLLDKDSDFNEDGRETYKLSKVVSRVLDNSKAEYNSTQRALDVASFLLLADRYACLIEAVTAICMMSHMGNALYWIGDGLIKWNKNLNLISKDYQLRLFESFKAGCIDDLDFACKLFSIYEGNLFGSKLSNDMNNMFANEYSLNLETFTIINKTRNDLIEKFSGGKKEIKIRNLNLNLVSRVRIVASLAWPDRVVSIKKGDEILFENKELDIVGTISENCAGDWANEKKAILGILDQNQNFISIDGKRVKAPVSNFMIKCITPVPSNDIINITNSFKTYSQENSSNETFSNLVSDLNTPINRKVIIDTESKPIKIISSFSLKQHNTNSENIEDLFIKLQYNEKSIENKSSFEIEIDEELHNENSLIIERWKNNKNKPIAVLNRYVDLNSNPFEKIKLGDTIEAIIKRPIFNIRNFGLREIIGFIILIEGHYYTLPIENIFIEYEKESLKELIGKKIKLIKSGLTPTAKQPIFSIVPLIEKERQSVLKLKEVSGTIVKMTSHTIYCKVIAENVQFVHLVSIPTSSLNEDRRFLEIGGEVKIDLTDKSEHETSTIDCLNDEDLFDLTDDEKKTVKELVNKIKKNQNQNSAFTDCSIEINYTKLSTSKRLSFEKIILLTYLYPKLSDAIKVLYIKSWEIKGQIKLIQMKVELEEKSRKAKINIQNNLEKNRTDLIYAESSLYKLMENGNKLKDMINNARTEEHKSKVTNWLFENNAKVQRKLEWIEKLKMFIKEDEYKLKNWK